MERLRELVYLSIGRASMCWSENPTSVFDEARALYIANTLILAIEQHVETVEAHAQAVASLTSSEIIRDGQGNEIARRK